LDGLRVQFWHGSWEHDFSRLVLSGDGKDEAYCGSEHRRRDRSCRPDLCFCQKP